MIKTDQENIQVLLRIRPLNSREKAEGATPCMEVDPHNPTTVTIEGKPYNYDYISGAETTQEDIFHIVGKPVALAWLEGYNACIFAYGQTGAGKTFTMQGKGLLEEGADSLNRGLQPRVFDYVFGLLNSLKKENPENEYIITCNYLEIYNEQIMDLLAENKPDANPKLAQLSVREDLKKGVYVENLCEESSESSEDAISLLLRGASSRHVGSTKMNADSSRSHSVFTLNFQSKVSTNGMIHVKNSKLHFVDLAGSERQKSTGASGDRLKEASNINKSLTVLGQVINALVESSSGKSRHIPYRDSKLTFILKDSLGGNSRTFMIAACSEANTQFQETLSTLKFAQRAKMIKNKASVNEESQGNVAQLKKEISKLKEDLAEAKKLAQQMEENQRNMTRIITPAKYTPSSFNHEAVIQFQQKNFRDINNRLEEITVMMCKKQKENKQMKEDFYDQRSRVEECFVSEKLNVLKVFQLIIEQGSSNPQNIDLINILLSSSKDEDRMEEEGMQGILSEIDAGIIEEIQSMNQTKLKLLEFEEQRNDFTEKLDRIGLMKFASPEKEKELQEIIQSKDKEIAEQKEQAQHAAKIWKQQMEELKIQLVHMKEINEGLVYETEQAKVSIQRNNQHHEERLQQFRSGYESKLAEYDESSSEIRIKNMELSDLVDDQKEQIDQLTALKEDIKNRWEQTHENFQKSLQQKNELANEKDELTEKLQRAIEQLKESRFHANDLENIINQDKLHTLTLEQELAHLKQIIKDKDNAIDMLNNRFEEEQLRLHANIDHEKEKVSGLEDEINRLKEDVETACSTLEFMDKQSEEKRIQMNQLNETLKEESAKKEKAEAELEYLINSEESEFNVALRKSVKLENDIEEMNKLVQEKVQELQGLHGDLEVLLETLNTNEKTIESLQQELQGVKQQVEEKNAQISQLQVNFDKVQANYLSKTEEHSELVCQFGEVNLQMKDLSEQFCDLSEQHNKVLYEIEEKNGQIVQQEEEIKGLKENNELKELEITELKQELTGRIQEIAQRDEIILEKNGEIIGKDGDIQGLKDQLNEVIEELSVRNGVIIQRDQQIEQMNKVITEKEEILGMKCQEIDMKNQEIVAQELKIQEKDMNITENLKRIEECAENILNLQERLVKEEEKLSQVNMIAEEQQQKLEAQTNSIIELNEQIQNLNGLVSDKEQEIEQNKQIINGLNEDITKISSEALNNQASFEQQIQELNGKQQIAQETIDQMREISEKQVQEITGLKEKVESQSEEYEQLNELRLIQDEELQQFKTQIHELSEQLGKEQFEKAEIDNQLRQAIEDAEMLRSEVQEKQLLYEQSETNKEEIVQSKNEKIEQLIAERKAQGEEIEAIQQKYMDELQANTSIQAKMSEITLENEQLLKQAEDTKIQRENFESEKQKFEEERAGIMNEMNSKDQIISKFKEEYQQIGNKFKVFRNLHDQIEEQKNSYQQKFIAKTKDLDSFEQKYAALQSIMEKLNEKLTIKQLEANKLQNQLLIIQSNREKNQSIQEDLQRDLRREKDECQQAKEKINTLLRERQIQASMRNNSNFNNQSSGLSSDSNKKLEEENEKLKDQMQKYKQLVEKKIQEIVEKLNRGISSAAILKEIANSAEIAKKIESQTESINKSSMETFECCNILKNYLLDSKKNLIDSSKKEEFLQKITSGDNLAEFREVFQVVLKNVEERERRVSHELLQLKEKKASYEFYRSKCEELEFKYEKITPHSPEMKYNRKRKYSLKENEAPILGEVDLNKKIKSPIA